MKNPRFFVMPIVVGVIVAILTIQWLTLEQKEATPQVVLVEQQTATSARSLGPVSYADAVDRAQPSVVNIYTSKIITRAYNPFYDDPVFKRFFGLNSPPRRQRMQSSLGSGVIVSPSGYVLTNNHVIADADEIKVALSDGREAFASIVGTDPETDLAVLFIEIPDLPSIVLAKRENVRVGDVVLAIGNPYGVGQTVTKGIVSALGRHQTGLSSFVDFIQTDAAINPGNSGGALINALGELVGINTGIFTKTGGSQGIGFAIPVSLAKSVLMEIVQHGAVIRGWLGIEPQVLNEQLAKSLGVPNIPGLLVSGIFKNGPAHIAGVQPGDIITMLDGKLITDPKEAMNLISSKRPKEQVKIGILRQGKEYDIVATVGERPVPN